MGGPMETETCSPKRPVPAIHLHGSDDEFAPFNGGREKDVSGTKFYSVEHSIQAWVNANGCDGEPVTTRLPDRTQDGTTIVRRV